MGPQTHAPGHEDSQKGGTEVLRVCKLAVAGIYNGS